MRRLSISRSQQGQRRFHSTNRSACFHNFCADTAPESILTPDQVAALYEGFTVGWDENGNIATNDAGNDIAYTFNWDNKLRKAEWPPDDSFVEIKYDPLGNRVWKRYTTGDPPVEDEHKYIVDITGRLPVILMDLNLTDSSLKKKYIYADRQILAQHDIDDDATPDPLDFKYFYLRDRLGSVRLVIDDDGDVVSHYTYEPFGELIDDDGTFDNVFRFTGQYFDAEIEEYYLRARQYNPTLARFTTRDPVFGKFEQPLTLHKYLYCGNDPVNGVDPLGLDTMHVQVSGMASLGFSAMAQFGIVVDDNFNIGTMITHNSWRPIETPPPGFTKWGMGYGLPAASVGLAFGWTNADTIFDLEGPGISVGGSIGSPLWGPSLGADYLSGVQRDGQLYHGFEITPAMSVGSFGFEAHGHYTWTEVISWDALEQHKRDMMRKWSEDQVLNAQTVGQGYFMLQVWSRM